jgi:predicted transcriptional regulator
MAAIEAPILNTNRFYSSIATAILLLLCFKKQAQKFKLDLNQLSSFGKVSFHQIDQ